MTRPARKLAWSVLACAAGLVLVESGAWTWEQLHPRFARTVPTPAPVQRDEYQARLSRLRAEAGLGTPLVEDEARGWAPPAGGTVKSGDIVARINSVGMRGPEIAPKRRDEIRLMSLGDSSVFGHGVPERAVFTEVAARELERRWKRPVSAVNGASPGHDSGQSLATLKRYGRLVDPDWLVVGNLWSDVYRNELGEAQPADLPARIRTPLRRLATYRLLRRLLAPWLRARRVRWLRSAGDVGTGEGCPECRVPLADYARNLGAMADLAAGLGAGVSFVLLPAPMDFDRAPVPETVREYREAMRQVAREHGAPLVDGPAVFQARGASEAWFLDTVHPSARGHAIIGEALADALAARGAIHSGEP